MYHIDAILIPQPVADSGFIISHDCKSLIFVHYKKKCFIQINTILIAELGVDSGLFGLHNRKTLMFMY